jgi:apolipoprotein N-acyltransferase
MGREPTFRLAAAISALLGLLFLFSSWDGLYRTLDLPRAAPALGPQIGSLAIFGLAYVLWSAVTEPTLARPAAIAGVLFYLGSALVIASWLIFKSKGDLTIDSGGVAILIVAAVGFAALAAALVRVSRERSAGP